ncbi:MAG TPA: hypothetical protein VNG33_18480 [Polyangiaceae bacterium]|nr:hypothetical protein [Polyangiaceae bacterium]
MRLKVSFRGARLFYALAVGTGLLGGAAVAHAAEAAPKERQLTPEEIDAWLDSRAMPKSQGDHGTDDDDAEAPPPPPRKKGFVIESSVGVLGQIGSLKHIIPNAPWFGLHFGYEPLRVLMVFAETDLFVTSTTYAHEPPPPRSFAFWNVGGGARLTLKPTERFGIYIQGSIGGGRATEDVLKIYGYHRADSLGFYQSGELGLEWYQVNPHLALVTHGGVRNYPRNFVRDRDTGPPMAWLGSAGLRYTF